MENKLEVSLDFGQNAGYVAELLEQYNTDPGAVSHAWAKFFSGDTSENGHGGVSVAKLALIFKALKAIHAYRERGHLKANINPIKNIKLPRATASLPVHGDFSAEELSENVFTDGATGRPNGSLGELLKTLEAIYCGTVGFEYTHIDSDEQRAWLRSKIEGEFARRSTLDKEQATVALRDLIAIEVFESELHKKYVGQKRFSIQGSETALPVLTTILNTLSTEGCKEVLIGMAHRGRLGILHEILGKPLADILVDFDDVGPKSLLGGGDVKYHLGYQNKRRFTGGEMYLEMMPNPSHLEFINPVVAGAVRARQRKFFKSHTNAVAAVLLHGDAAFVGQGVVWETLNMANTPAYTVGGTIHIVTNNQVGFTTDSEDGRSSNYVTDFAKSIGAPIFHVNSEDVEAALWVAKVAAEFRQKFGRDVVIDIYGYRKYGHNEGDDPTFTQPTIYGELKGKQPLWKMYSQELIAAGRITSEECDQIVKQYTANFDNVFEKRQTEPAKKVEKKKFVELPEVKTALGKKDILIVADAILPINADGVHPKLKEILGKRIESVKKGESIEWGTGEALAFGSLLKEGHPVRLTGQDVRRGTFSHRHLGLVDYGKGSKFAPFDSLTSGGSYLEVFNSTLSEAAVIGFEFGYSTVQQDGLVIWEAQFGDFGNGGQVLIDQFIGSSEIKWDQRSGIVLLLPHGFEGQGPEHSSARLERYLQLCANKNMSICNLTTAAQYFHLLRRQGIREVKRPVIVMSPKSLLRSVDACSPIGDFERGSFKPIIIDNEKNIPKASSIFLCSGKIAYELLASFKKAKVEPPLVRVEEMHPFPEMELEGVVKKGGSKTKFIWVQEEPENNGAFTYMAHRFYKAFGINLDYIGRPEYSGVAGGSLRYHIQEQAEIISNALKIA